MSLYTVHPLVQTNNIAEITKLLQETKRVQKDERYWAFDSTMKSIMRDAVCLGRDRIAQLFLENGFCANTKVVTHDNPCYMPLIYHAAKVGSLPVVQLLVEHGATIRDEGRVQEDNQEALRVSIQGGHADVVTCLLENGGSAKGRFGLMGGSFLTRAALEGKNRIVQALCKHGASPIISLNDIACTEKSLDQRIAAIKILLDYTVAKDLGKGKKIFSIEGLDISGCNFAGVSLGGWPIRRKMLLDKKLLGADKAIVTLDDLSMIEDPERRAALSSRIHAAIQSQGGTIYQGGVINLVPLIKAAKKYHIGTVKERLAAGVDPNLNDSGIKTEHPLVASARKGHEGVVRLLAEHPKIDKKYIPSALKAAEAANRESTAEYLRSKMDVNDPDAERNRRIHYAINNNDIEEVGRLLDRGADCTFADKDGRLPLSLACNKKNANIDMILLLLSRGADPNKGSPLAHAVAHGNTEAVAALLPLIDKKEYIYSIPSIRIGKETCTYSYPWYVPLVLAAYNRPMILHLLKGYGADLNARYTHDEEGYIRGVLDMLVDDCPSLSNPCQLARDLSFFFSGCEDSIPLGTIEKEIFKLFEEQRSAATAQKVEVNPASGNNKTPNSTLSGTQKILTSQLFEQLLSAFHSKLKEKEIFKLKEKEIFKLKEKEIFKFIEGQRSAFHSWYKKLEFLLENGVGPSIVRGDKKSTNLHILLDNEILSCVEGASKKIIELFLFYGHYVDAVAPENGFTPLLYATYNGNEAAVQCLITHGANVHAKITFLGQTPLHIAAEKGLPTITKLLLDAHANPSVQDQDGNTPLQLSLKTMQEKQKSREFNKKPYIETQRLLMQKRTP